LKKHIEKVAPNGVEVDVQMEKLSAKAYMVEPTHPLIEKASARYERAFDKETAFVRMVGTIPGVEWFDALYHIPIILLGFGTPHDRTYAPNECFPLDSFDKGMETLVYYYEAVSK